MTKSILSNAKRFNLIESHSNTISYKMLYKSFKCFNTTSYKYDKFKSDIDKLKDSVFFDKNALAHEQEKLAELEISLQKAIGTSRDNLAAQAQSTEGTKKFAIAIDDLAVP